MVPMSTLTYHYTWILSLNYHLCFGTESYKMVGSFQLNHKFNVTSWILHACGQQSRMTSLKYHQSTIKRYEVCMRHTQNIFVSFSYVHITRACITVEIWGKEKRGIEFLILIVRAGHGRHAFFSLDLHILWDIRPTSMAYFLGLSELLIFYRESAMCSAGMWKTPLLMGYSACSPFSFFESFLGKFSDFP